ncbi:MULTISPECIES: hemerythrin domain-containing protein [unclassified Streptomyces]|uniref:hemerythrin domain-containing protein n=1 Tax=unclassified Streptomyces TaxID=2593676 RepID=UPI000DC7DDD7|nr:MULTISPECIES: hemerythrin domain-containing protein [unclassified Streptomyces]AWZ09819.1 hemerythrin domain-containing protein [Streptomyces sp. ICC4]AWZ16356.1 hemerythrin domain-containing protein [Streptomyces sp. ICC1]
MKKTREHTPRGHTPRGHTLRARPDTHEMVVIHRGLRREARLLVELVAAVAPGDTARARVLADHFRDYRLGLHHHHQGEDEHLWPPLLARVDLEADVVLRMEAQHERVAATLSAAVDALSAWENGARETGRDAFVAVLAEHRAVLVEHLDDEEGSLLPLAARHLSAHEWGAMGEHFRASTPKPKLLFFLGMALEDADRSERASMLAKLPLAARLLWYAVGRPSYARRVRAIRRDTPR